MSDDGFMPSPPSPLQVVPGDAPEVSGQVDYFAFDEHYSYTLPDKKSWISFKAMTEGDRRKYLSAVSKEVKVRKGGEMSLQMSTGDDREALLLAAVTGWNLTRNGAPIAFTKAALVDFLAVANPKVLDGLEKEVRKANPWLLADMSLEDIDREIANLQEMRAVKAKEEEKEATFH